MRVLYVEFVNGFGGSLTCLLDTVQALPAGIEPILAIQYDPTPFRALPCGLRCEIVTVPYHRISGEGRHTKLARFVRGTYRWASVLDKLVQKLHPDLIHANNMCSINVAAGIVGKRHGIPVVSHQRELEYAGWTNWTVLKSGIFSHHIASSQAIVRSLARLGVPEKSCSLIYDPVPERPPSPVTVKKNGKPLVVAMYSMLMPWKGQEVFMRAVDHVYRRVDRPFRTIVGGSEPFRDTGYLAQLKQLSTDLGLDSRVEFPGFVQDINQKLSETDIMVLASVDPEPGGHVIQEAMMCGVPVVVTDDGGPSEYARSCNGGLVVPRGDVGAMAEAIERLLLDDDLRGRIALRGQEFAQRAFDPLAIGSRIATIYRDCLNRA